MSDTDKCPKCPVCGQRWMGEYSRCICGYDPSDKSRMTEHAATAAMHRIRELEQIIENVVELLEAQACPKHMDAAKKMPFSDFAEEEKRIGCSRCMVERIRELEAQRDAACKYLERLFVHILREHFPENNITQALSGDLLGLITQIDNALTAWRELEARYHKLETAYANREERINELEARIETLELTVKVLESDKQTRNDALDHERARIAAKDEALKEIATQKLVTEMDAEEYEHADFEGGYIAIVEMAREALKK